MIRKSLLVAICATLITGCATKTVVPPIAQELNQAVIRKITKVEVFYHPAEFAVVDLGGSGAAGMAGILGPVGMLIALGMDASSKLTFKQRVEARSKQFDAAVKTSSLSDVNLLQAEYLAQAIRRTGREARISKIERPLGGDAKAMAMGLGWKPADDHAGMVVRTTVGYGAESATASYKSIAINDFLLTDADGKTLAFGRAQRKDNGVTYQTFSGLLESHKTAVNSLTQDLIRNADEAMKKTLDLASFEPAGKAQ